MHCPHKRAIVVMELNRVKRYMGIFNLVSKMLNIQFHLMFS